MGVQEAVLVAVNVAVLVGGDFAVVGEGVTVLVSVGGAGVSVGVYDADVDVNVGVLVIVGETGVPNGSPNVARVPTVWLLMLYSLESMVLVTARWESARKFTPLTLFSARM